MRTEQGGTALEFELVGPAREPIDLWRTLLSHGVASLPPFFLDEERRVLEVTLPVKGSRPRTVRIRDGRPGFGQITVLGPRPGPRVLAGVVAAVRLILRLDEDLSAFYALAANDPDLSWVCAGAGRMIQSPTVFEEVVKTICTTNCAWSATERMVAALVAHLGEPAAGAPSSGVGRRAFPTPEAMARAGLDFYRDVARTGYRGAYLQALARSVADGAVDLEALGPPRRGLPLAAARYLSHRTPDSAGEIGDDEVALRLLALPGVGPYAAAHVMMMLGRYSRLILDSWTRPKYARLTGGRPRTDLAIARRFRRYGPYAGLAFWMFLTRDWVDPQDGLAAAVPLETERRAT